MTENLIGKEAKIVGYSTDGWPQGNFVAHVCLEIEGRRVFFQATDPTDTWECVEEPS